MNKKSIIATIAFGMLVFNGAVASEGKIKAEEFDVNSVIYIEEEEKIDLGFNTADYLPEDFNPYDFYYDLNWIAYEESSLEDIDVPNRLPANFDAYSNPKGIEGINYIDENDTIEIKLDTTRYLPKGFDPYKS